MIIKQVNLETVVGPTTRNLPENTLPEAAFAGKSNVGKSSCINAIMNRKSYARVSSQPGKTQTINYYNVNDAFYIVDLPGYGYARANLEAQAQWGRMIDRYLAKSRQLRIVFLLVDIRHDPGDNDRQMYEWITANGFYPVVIATKLDKIKRSQIAAKVAGVRRGLSLPDEIPAIPFSSVTKQGLDEIYEFIEKFVLNDGE